MCLIEKRCVFHNFIQAWAAVLLAMNSMFIKQQHILNKVSLNSKQMKNMLLYWSVDKMLWPKSCRTLTLYFPGEQWFHITDSGFSVTLQNKATVNKENLYLRRFGCRVKPRAAPQGLGVAAFSSTLSQRNDGENDYQNSEGTSPGESTALRGTLTAQVTL